MTGPRNPGDVGTGGIDAEADYRLLPHGFDGGVWTNRIEVVGPFVRRSSR